MKRSFYAMAMLAAVTATPAMAAWDFKVIEDPMTDAKRGISSLEGDGGVLVVKCDKNGPGSIYVSVISRKYLGGTRGNRVRDLKYRADGGEVQSISASHDGQSASVFDLKPESNGGIFLKQIMAAGRLVVQATAYDYEAIAIVFDATGADAAIRRSAETCGDTQWSQGTANPM